MSIYSKEIVRCNGDMKVYVRVQNDYSGKILEGIRNIFSDGDRKYFHADGCKHDVTTLVEEYRRNEEMVKAALTWHKQAKF